MELPGTASLTNPKQVGCITARVRRLADLSQRELAARVGLSAAAVARIESGSGLPSLTTLSRIVEVAGLRLSVLDPHGNEVVPVPDDTVRDNQGRRFPAHLDVAPPDEVPYERWAYPRYDRPTARGWYHLRPARDRDGADGGRRRPEDHPTERELETRSRLMAGPQPTVSPAPGPHITCQCLDECFETWCVDVCPCRCEPPPPTRLTRRRPLAG